LVKRGDLKALPLDGIEPTIANAEKGSYALTGPLTVVYQRWDSRRMAPFLDFLFSDTGRQIISEKLVPVSKEHAGYNSIRDI
jgi:phosphate transport system substrate-binding protein